MTMRYRTGWIALLLGAMGCAATPSPTVPAAGAILGENLAPHTFGSHAELRASIRAASQSRGSCVLHARSSDWRSSANAPRGLAPALAPGGAAEEASATIQMFTNAPAGGAAASRPGDAWDYSRTNAQHDGIDEPHNIKTDGRFVYTITESSLFIADVQDGNNVLVGSLILPGRASGMLLDGDHVVVTGAFKDRKQLVSDSRHDELTYVAVIDVSSRHQPRLTARHVLEGELSDSRLMSGVGYFVTSTHAFVRNEPTPVVLSGSDVHHVALTQTIAHRQPRERPSFATVHAVRLSEPASVSSRAVLMGNPTVIYMSPKHVYLADTASVNGADLQNEILPELIRSKLTDEDRSLIAQLESVDDAVFSPLERRDKVGDVYCDRLDALEPEERDELTRRAQIAVAERLTKLGAPHATAIHRVSLDGTSLSVGPSGVVAGRPLNQFSFDEHEGMLRVATTRLHDNVVLTLSHDLEVVGELEGLGKDERIYAARFVEDRAYLVTFQEVDPFYVIDLTDPKKPKKLGELKLPGVSRYLHPWGRNTVLGVGTVDGARRGLKVSLFDVSDVAAPREATRLTYDELFTNLDRPDAHRGLIIDRVKGVLVVPIHERGKNGVGALVVGATASQLTERGIVHHDSSEWTALGVQNIEGSIYVGNRLFTKSSAILQSNSLLDATRGEAIFLK